MHGVKECPVCTRSHESDQAATISSRQNCKVLCHLPSCSSNTDHYGVQDVFFHESGAAVPCFTAASRPPGQACVITTFHMIQNTTRPPLVYKCSMFASAVVDGNRLPLLPPTRARRVSRSSPAGTRTCIFHQRLYLINPSPEHV